MELIDTNHRELQCWNRTVAEGCCRQQGAILLEAPAHTAIGCFRGVWGVRWLHYSAAGDVDETAIRSGTLCEFRGQFHTCVADQTHTQYLAHLVMLDLCVGQASDLIRKTAEDLGESSPFCLRVCSCKRLRRSIGVHQH